jgi:hypothetical protein
MSLSDLYEIKEALEDLDIRNADVRVTIKDGEVEVELYESCTIY